MKSVGKRTVRDADAASRSALAIRACARLVFSVAALVVLYYAVPFDRPLDVSLIMLLIAWGALFVGLFVFQIRAVVRSPMPEYRALQALAFSVPLLVLSFASAYYLMSKSNPPSFTESLSRTDALYFALTVFSTVGFGDIGPGAPVGRVVVTVQIAANLLVLGLGVRILTGAVDRSRQRRQQRPDLS